MQPPFEVRRPLPSAAAVTMAALALAGFGLGVPACAGDADVGGGAGMSGGTGNRGGGPGNQGGAGAGTGGMGLGGRPPDTGIKPMQDTGTRGTPVIALGDQYGSQGMCSGPGVGKMPLRRVARIEFNNAVADLFGVRSAPAANFVDEEDAGAYNGFGSNIVTPISTLAVEEYLSGGEAVADEVAANVAARTGCSAATDATCIKNFLAARARRAWRGVFPDDEKADLFAKYDAASAALGAPAALKLGVLSVLLSPRFLYVVELGAGSTGVGPLTPVELAGRLGAVIWRSVPDDTLLAAADGGRLGAAAGVMAEARRMLDDPRADAMLADFTRQWLDIVKTPSTAKDNAVWPTYTADLAADLVTQSEMVFRAAFRGGGTFASLLTSNMSVANSRIANFYGLTGAPATGFGPVTMPAGAAAGILTQGAVLAGHSHFARPSVVLRGKFVRTQLLCDPVAAPPNDVDTSLKPLTTGQTERDAASAHATEPRCAVCHTLLDPIGNGFEQFDAVGKLVGAGSGTGAGMIVKPVLTSFDDVSGAFTGPVELAGKLARSEHAQKCFALQAMRYALGRDEAASDACSASQLWKSFMTGGQSVKEAFVAFTGTDSFRYRYYGLPGGACQ